MIHHIRRIFPDSSVHDDAVSSASIAEYLCAELAEPGKFALFVDAVCLVSGHLCEKERMAHERAQFMDMPLEQEGQPRTHAVFRIYADDSIIRNGVKSSNLAEYLQYELTKRPGCALIVDGVCVYRGCLQDDQIVKAEKVTAGLVVNRDTAPYR